MMSATVGQWVCISKCAKISGLNRQSRRNPLKTVKLCGLSGERLAIINLCVLDSLISSNCHRILHHRQYRAKLLEKQQKV